MNSIISREIKQYIRLIVSSDSSIWLLLILFYSLCAVYYQQIDLHKSLLVLLTRLSSLI